MAMCFEFNSPNRILRCRLWGRVSDEGLMNFDRMATLLSESLDPLSGISDFSAVTSFECTPELIRTLAAFPLIIPQPSRPGSLLRRMKQLSDLRTFLKWKVIVLADVVSPKRFGAPTTRSLTLLGEKS
jgi:hypothetical protein